MNVLTLQKLTAEFRFQILNKNKTQSPLQGNQNTSKSQIKIRIP